MTIPMLILAGLVGAVANRFSGYTNIAALPGRNVYYAALFVAACAVWAFGLIWGLAVVVSFLAYRLPGWYHSIDAGANEDTELRDFLVMFGRGLFFIPVFLAAVIAHTSLIPLVPLVIASLNGAAAYWTANHKKVVQVGGDPMWFAELLTGAGFGMAVISVIL